MHKNPFHSFFFPLIHLTFFLSFFRLELSTPEMVLGVVLTILSLLGFRFLYPRRAQLNRNYFEIISVATGALLTYFLNVKLATGPVLAAGLVGFIASFLPYLNRKNKELSLQPFAIYCGAFVGMSGGFVLESYFLVTLAGLISGLIYVLTNNTLNGIGGKHGTIAFTGVLIVQTILYVL